MKRLRVVGLFAASSALRILIASSGYASTLQQRFELSTPADSLPRLKEALFLSANNLSPYAGSSFHGQPIVWASWAAVEPLQHALGSWAYVVPALLCELAAALSLLRLAVLVKQQAGDEVPEPVTVVALFLFNPYQLLSTCSGTTAQLETAAIFALLASAAARSGCHVGVAAALSVYVSPHTLLLLPMIAVVLVTGRISEPKPASVKFPDPTQLSDMYPSDVSDTQQHETQHSREPSPRPNQQAPQCPQAGGLSQVQPTASRPASSATQTAKQTHASLATVLRQLQRHGPLLYQVGGVLLAMLSALWLLSDALMWQFPGHKGHGLLGTIARLLGFITNTPSSCSAGVDPAPWYLATYHFMWEVQNLQPSIGQHWYYWMEMFPHFQRFFQFVFHGLSALFALPLLLRLPHRPLLALLLQLVITAFLRPYPSVADVARYLALLPLFPHVLSEVTLPVYMLMGTILLLLTLLIPAMWNHWVITASANSNYLYSMVTLAGVWQVAVVVLLLRAALQVDRKLSSKPLKYATSATK